MTTEQATDLLTAAYKAEVEYRHRQYVDDEATRSNIQHLAGFLTSDNSKFGVMLCGLCGNGKTTILHAFQNALNYLVGCGLYEDNNTGIRIVGSLDVVHYSKDYDQFQALKNRDMLAIDDMGREPREVLDYGNVLNPVIDLLEYRYDAQLFTMITTNVTASKIREHYGERLADRFNEMLEVIVFKNATYRRPQ